MRVTAHTEPGGSEPNEDWVSFTEDLVVVLDGATSRTETGCVHGVAWFVRKLGLSLMSLAGDPSTALVEALAGAIEHVASLHPECDLSHPATPSAAVGMLRQRANQLEVLVLADVTAVIEGTDGSISVLTDGRPDSAAGQLADALALSIDDEHRQDALRAVKRAQLRARNKPGGYYVASSDPTAALEATTDTFEVPDISTAALLSDGAARVIDLYGLMSWPDLVAILDQDGPGVLINSVRSAEAADPTTTRWPRSKLSDDATVAFARIAGAFRRP